MKRVVHDQVASIQFRPDAHHRSVQAVLEDPKGLVKAIGVPVQEHSQWDVAFVRKHEPAQARLRRVVVIIIHFSNCSGVIIVAY